MLLDKKLTAVCTIASKEEGRPVLQAVKLANGKATATDGFRLLEIDLPKWDKYEEELPTTGHEPLTNDEPYQILATELKKALDLIPTKTTLPILQHAWTAKGTRENTVKIISTNLETTNSPEFTLVEGNYPEVDKIKPQEAPVFEISVNAKLLAELLQAMVKAEPLANTVKMSFYDPLKVVKLEAQDFDKRNIVGYIMPVRAE